MKILERVSFNYVEKILRNSLALEDNLEINPCTKIKDLGAEPIDILDIYFRLGMDFSKYTSGERLNKQGKRVLYRIAENNRRNENYDKTNHFIDLAQSQTTNEFINRLVVQDFVELMNN